MTHHINIIWAEIFDELQYSKQNPFPTYPHLGFRHILWRNLGNSLIGTLRRKLTSDTMTPEIVSCTTIGNLNNYCRLVWTTLSTSHLVLRYVISIQLLQISLDKVIHFFRAAGFSQTRQQTTHKMFRDLDSTNTGAVNLDRIRAACDFSSLPAVANG